MPQRIVSLVPSQTELLFDLGLDRAIVGRTKFCIHPADKVRSVPPVGGTKTINSTQLLALRPTLVLANKEENVREQVAELARYVPVHVTDVNTVADALAMIRQVGALVGRAEAAHTLADAIACSFDGPPDELGSDVPEKPRPRVAYFIWRKPWMVAAADTFIDAMLTQAGFRNAFADRSRYPVITEADLLNASPDLLFLSSEPYPFKDKHLADLQAVCPGARGLLVDGELFSWYGSRLLRSAAYFRTLHQRLNGENV